MHLDTSMQSEHRCKNQDELAYLHVLFVLKMKMAWNRHISLLV